MRTEKEKQGNRISNTFPDALRALINLFDEKAVKQDPNTVWVDMTQGLMGGTVNLGKLQRLLRDKKPNEIKLSDFWSSDEESEEELTRKQEENNKTLEMMQQWHEEFEATPQGKRERAAIAFRTAEDVRDLEFWSS